MNNFSVIAALSCAAMCVFACTKPAEAPAPEVSLEIGGTTSSSITFSVSAENAVKCAYVVVKSGETLPDAAAVLSDGTAVDLSASSEIVAGDLEPSTGYTVAAAVSSEDGRTAMSSADAVTEADPAFVMDRASARQYGSSNNFQITLRGTVDGVEYEIAMDIYDNDGKDAGYVTAGTYNIEEGNADGTVDPAYSYVQKDNDQLKFVSGTLEVGIADGAYAIRLDAVLSDDSTLVAVYNGTIEDINGVTWPKSE